MLGSIFQDLRYAIRQWRHAPAFVLTVIAVPALGVGANIAALATPASVFQRVISPKNTCRVSIPSRRSRPHSCFEIGVNNT